MPFGPVAQLARAPALQAGGREFESPQVQKARVTSRPVRRNPSGYRRRVAGSSPARSTTPLASDSGPPKLSTQMNLPKKWATINSITTFEAPFQRGSWKTRSNGNLSVLFAIPNEAWPWIGQNFPNYDNKELENISNGQHFDIRGLRSYAVENLPVGTIGATEYHRIRQEIIVTTQGVVEWQLEDLDGNIRSLIIPAGQGLYVPSFIRHTYSAKKENSCLVVICNTLFNPDDPATHDSYTTEQFYELQQAVKIKN